MTEKCPIWGLPASLESFESAVGSKAHWVSGYHVSSPRAGGRYSIEKSAYDLVGSTKFDDRSKARLTTWLVDHRRMGIESPKVTVQIVEGIQIGSALSVPRRADRLLQSLAKRSSFLGDTVYFYPNFETSPPEQDEDLELLAVSESLKKSELDYLFDFLTTENLLDETTSSHDRRCFILSPRGYAHLSDLETKKVDSSQGFVAMWFGESMDDVFINGFEKGIGLAGYKPLRIDRKDHNNKIDDEIISEIRRSRFLVADFTHGPEGARGGVYYEAGFAHGLGLHVFFTCREDCIQNAHFDTRQYNHIVWKTADDLKIRLAQRISATIGDGPLLNKSK